MDRTAVHVSRDGRLFLAGLAAEALLLREVLGDYRESPMWAEGLTLAPAQAGPWRVAVPDAAGKAPGVVLELDAAAALRLDFVLQALGLSSHDLPGVQARTYVGPAAEGAADPGPDAPEALPVIAALVQDILLLQGQATPQTLAARLGPMLVRAASRLRALSEAHPTTLRHRAGPQDVQIAASRQPYGRFFAVEEHDLSWRRFAGVQSEVVTRAAFVSGDAVTVLPYDPVRDRVLVVEQFRAGPLARGDAQCWQIEAIAGRVDPFETPETAARREAEEEAGLVLTDLIPVARYYPSPGAMNEYLYSYLAVTDLPDGSAGVFGLAGEAEDIRGHLLSFDRMMELVTSGEIENAPLILTALWLQRARPGFR